MSFLSSVFSLAAGDSASLKERVFGWIFPLGDPKCERVLVVPQQLYAEVDRPDRYERATNRLILSGLRVPGWCT